MARVFIILLTFFYTLSATGATQHLIDCCGALQKFVKLDKQAPSCCMDMDGSDDRCNLDQARHCKDVKVEAQKTATVHLPSTDVKLVKTYPLERWVVVLVGFSDHLPELQNLVRMIEVPPEGVTTPLFIQHCTYRI